MHTHTRTCMHTRTHLPRASHPKRVSNRDRPSVDVHLGVVDAQHVSASERHDRKGLIQLPQVDVIDPQPVALKQARHRHRRPYPHLFWGAAAHREPFECAERCQAPTLGLSLLHQHAPASRKAAV